MRGHVHMRQVCGGNVLWIQKSQLGAHRPPPDDDSSLAAARQAPRARSICTPVPPVQSKPWPMTRFLPSGNGSQMVGRPAIQRRLVPPTILFLSFKDKSKGWKVLLFTEHCTSQKSTNLTSLKIINVCSSSMESHVRNSESETKCCHLLIGSDLGLVYSQ